MRTAYHLSDIHSYPQYAGQFVGMQYHWTIGHATSESIRHEAGVFVMTRDGD